LHAAAATTHDIIYIANNIASDPSHRIVTLGSTTTTTTTTTTMTTTTRKQRKSVGAIDN